MKRDLDLVRKLLLAVEQEELKNELFFPVVEAYDVATISYHTDLLQQAGLIKALDVSDAGGPRWMAGHLTWKGQEFLDACRDQKTWDGAKEKLRREVGFVTYELLRYVLEELPKTRLK